MVSAVLTTPSSNSERIFYQVSKDSPKMEEVRKIFNQILVPLYGSQEKALNQIAESRDRVCHLLYENEHPTGLIVFKTVLSDEFKEFGIKNSIEIKSLFVVNSENNSGRGLGTALLNKVIEEANKLNLNHSAFHVTVSNTKKESLNFFQNKGFRVVHAWTGRYKKEEIEYLLKLDAQKVQIASQEALSLTKKLTDLKSEEKAPILQQKPFAPKVLGSIKNAHWDDIHALKKLSDGTFVSGSKDSSLCKWSQDGQLIKVVRNIEPTEVDERDWVTAIGVFNDDYWMSGDRNGRITLWNTEGDFIRHILPKLPKSGHISHKYNARRINCLVPGLSPTKPNFFIGLPTMFDEYNFIESKTVASTKVHENDWVYCIHPLSDKQILAVTAGVLDIWEKSNQAWQKKTTILQEGKREKNTRRHISSLTRLESSPNQFGIGIFGGVVQVIDIETKQSVNTWHEHKDRVWSIENISKEVFASSGEDGFIRFWDPRASKSISSLGPTIGEVCTMLRLNENVLVAGACPKDPIQEGKGAELFFYDIRK